jgi:hypothetical protein
MGFLGTCITSYVHTDMLVVKEAFDTTLGCVDGEVIAAECRTCPVDT